VVQFKAALGLGPAETAPPLPGHFETTSLDLSAARPFETALARNTRLQEIAAEIQQAEAAMTLAYKARIPDTSLGLMADVKMNPVLYRPLATVSLPIWRDKIRAQIAEAQANKRAAEARLSSEQIALAVAWAEKSFVYREATRTLALLEGELLPKQSQSLEVARAGYLSGQIDFFNLTDAEQTLLKFRLDQVEAQTQREITLAELSLITEGMPPSSVSMGVSGGGASPSGGGSGQPGTSGSQMK